MERMTIHRALAELKLIDAKITKQTEELIPIGIKQKDKPVNGLTEEKDFAAQAQSKYDSITDLIKRKIALKSSIVAANGVTRVKIGEAEMTIADAITMKATATFKKNLAARLKTIQNQVVGNLNVNNEMVEANVQKLLEAALGKENVKVSSTDVDAIRKPYVDANVFTLVDPIKVTEKIEALEKEIGDFETEVDATLSEVNATTFIEI